MFMNTENTKQLNILAKEIYKVLIRKQKTNEKLYITVLEFK